MTRERTAAQPVAQWVDAGPASRPVVGLPGFTHRFATVEGIRLHYVIGGKTDGDWLVLAAGFPESWYAWRYVLPLLAAHFRIIAPDLPGQGDSDRPAAGYDTQSLAGVLHGLLQQLTLRRYYLAAHDVGAWVAWSYAALYGDEVRRLALLDAGIPGVTLPENLPAGPERGWRTWHFAFHQIADLPETLISGREREYLNWFLRRKAADPGAFNDEALEEYLRVFVKEGGLRAGLAYYRAAEVSARQNQAQKAAGKLRMPMLAVSADQGSITDMAGPLRPFAENVRGVVIAHCGHFIPEEQPAALAGELRAFFRA
ncbi:alpha/beta fold hydrolase [Martelella alba]|uniref:Alpha/beta fold hydrolase n=1 Tax=Martelella alba TaxID=2590451 RepID=A0ABY2SJ65_9HYPH|nr:alpha/beta fold hydrolase [Martelella alba]TKI05502.1 alpha/beta fold hydrolase [Martelella alba]